MGEAVSSSLVGKVVDLLCGVAKKEISYMWNASENVQNLKNEVEKLRGMKGRVQQQMDLANSKGEPLLEGVEGWMKNADAKISEATAFINEEAEADKACCNLRLCINLGTLYHYGKTATKKTSFLQQHRGDGKDFETCVSLPARPLAFTDVYQSKNLEDINTQKWTLENIIRAVKDDTIQIVGIIGLGGVGKTTLASEVAEEMKSQFAEVVFIRVSKNIDTKMIKEKVQVAARRIINGDKVLIILDDVWGELKLDELDIPCGSNYMNCKILLTSRSRDVCNKMNAQKIISLNPLTEKEAWTLFERAVGKPEWDNRLKQVALEIVKECGGLPLFVQAVAKALKGKQIASWEAALGRLKNPTDEDAPFKIEGIMQLKLSYDYLESKVAKLCFLLCGMFPEDGFIGFKKLTHYGLALGVFDNLDSSILDAKEIVQVAVDTLKSSFLLLPQQLYIYDDDEKLFTMHDLVRDMAILITSKGNDKFWVQSGTGLREWQPKKHLEIYKKISLMGNKIYKFPDHELLFPHLDTFLIQDNALSFVPDEFFRGMLKLKVLDMSRNKITSLPQSLKQLTELVMLDLSGNRSLTEISILGELTCLEILKLRRTGITSIPKEIGKLINLRLLDVYNCENLFCITTGVMSKLTRLEELRVQLKEVGKCNFFVELGELKSLRSLYLLVPALHYIPEYFPFETLIEFNIYVLDREFHYQAHEYKRNLLLTSCSFPFTITITKLVQVSEMLILLGINDLDNILPVLYGEGVHKLRKIKLWACGNVRSLVRTCDLDELQNSTELGPMETNEKLFSQVEGIDLYSLNRLEILWDGLHQYISFCNLAKIEITNCSSLLNLFPASVARELVNLRELGIQNCKSLVVVISAGDEIEQTGGSKIEFLKHDTYIMFSRLNSILFNDLPKLESFYSGHSIIQYPSLKVMKVEHCRSMKRWSYGDNHMPNLDFDDQAGINDYIAAAKREMNEDWSILKYPGTKSLDMYKS